MYLVVGGGAYDLMGDHTIVATTEILHEGGDSWTQVGSLPQAMIGLRAVSINNGIIATGDIYTMKDCMVTDSGDRRSVLLV